MTCEIKDARICRKCSLVTVDQVCDLCGKRTAPHPDSASPDAAQYCVDCAGEFAASEIVVRTWKDDPYQQLDDGTLITVCLNCEAARKAEFDEECST